MPRDGASEESAAPAADVELELDSRAVGTAVRRVPLRVTVGLSTIATGTWFLWMGGETLAYALCVTNGKCPPPPAIDTISNTWAHAPGEYFARVFTGVTALNFAVLNIALWVPEGEPRRDGTGGADVSARFKGTMLTVLLSIFMLTLCVSICVLPNDPECMGNGNIHDTTSGMFFTFYDVNMLLFTTRKYSGPRLYVGALLFLCFVVAIVLICVNNRSILIPFEYANVVFMISWTTFQVVRKRRGYTAAILPRSEARARQLVCVRTRYFSYGVLAMYTATLLLSWVLSPSSVPLAFTQMWTTRPANWLSRWACVQVCVPLALVHVCIHVLDREEAGVSSPALGAATASALVAMGGLVVAMAVNRSENQAVHDAAAVTFALAYALYAGMRAAVLATRRGEALVAGPLLGNTDGLGGERVVQDARACARLARIASAAKAAQSTRQSLLAAVVVGLALLRVCSGGSRGSAMQALLEWGLALGLGLHVLLAVRSAGSLADSTVLAILRPPDGGIAAYGTDDAWAVASAMEMAAAVEPERPDSRKVNALSEALDNGRNSP